MLAADTGWWIALTAGFAAVSAFVIVVAAVLVVAARIADQAQAAAAALPLVRDQTAALRDAEEINGSAIALLRGVRAARKALTGY